MESSFQQARQRMILSSLHEVSVVLRNVVKFWRLWSFVLFLVVLIIGENVVKLHTIVASLTDKGFVHISGPSGPGEASRC